jgi:hypothetical protein
MTAEVWEACTNPDTMLVFLQGNASERKFLLSAVALLRVFRKAEGWPNRIDAAERFADGLIGVTDLRKEWELRLPGASWPERPFDWLNLSVSPWRSSTDPTAPLWQENSVRLLRDIFGNPFRPVTFSPSWRTDTAVALARQMYESRDFSAMPILADALQDAGCDSDDILNHCRGPESHVRGCWVVDLVLGKE